MSKNSSSNEYIISEIDQEILILQRKIHRLLREGSGEPNVGDWYNIPGGPGTTIAYFIKKLTEDDWVFGLRQPEPVLNFFKADTTRNSKVTDINMTAIRNKRCIKRNDEISDELDKRMLSDLARLLEERDSMHEKEHWYDEHPWNSAPGAPPGSGEPNVGDWYDIPGKDGTIRAYFITRRTEDEWIFGLSDPGIVLDCFRAPVYRNGRITDTMHTATRNKQSITRNNEVNIRYDNRLLRDLSYFLRNLNLLFQRRENEYDYVGPDKRKQEERKMQQEEEAFLARHEMIKDSQNTYIFYLIPALHGKGEEEKLNRLAYKEADRLFFKCYCPDFPRILFTKYYNFPYRDDIWNKGIADITTKGWNLWKDTNEDDRYVVFSKNDDEDKIILRFFLGKKEKHKIEIEPTVDEDHETSTRIEDRIIDQHLKKQLNLLTAAEPSYLGRIEFNMAE
jgi:hypothetical protein